MAHPAPASPRTLALVFLGGAIGTWLRAVIAQALPHPPSTWPIATFLVNISGAFLLGMLLAVLTRLGPDEAWRRDIRLFAGTGILGAYTTYSAFALEVVTLVRDGVTWLAVLYSVVSIALGLAAAWAGIAMGRQSRSEAAR